VTTQAQIDAVRNLLQHYLNCYDGAKDQTAHDAERAIAALTAAAGVETMTPTQAQIDAARRAIALMHYGYTEEEAMGLATAALAAAAEVGPLPQMVAQQNVRYEAAAIDRAIADTIDHCAQVAENFEWGKDDDNTTLAARIRALKDKPF
jgi:hypothetical protein